MSGVVSRVEFRFDAASHTYRELATGKVLPHVTGMLEATGWTDSLWFTEESSERGTAVHSLTADYDLEALDVETVVTPYKPYLLAHVKAMSMIPCEMLTVEEPFVHPFYRYGCRPDRLVIAYGRRGVLEIKSAAPAKGHPIQTALQAMVAEQVHDVPAEMQIRLCLYLKPNGRFTLEEHTDRGDFDAARSIIRETCRC